jgi:hypothetical protein
MKAVAPFAALFFASASLIITPLNWTILIPHGIALTAKTPLPAMDDFFTGKRILRAADRLFHTIPKTFGPTQSRSEFRSNPKGRRDNAR